MYSVFSIAPLVGSIGLACSQSVGALYLVHDVPAVEIAVEYELGEFNQQANFQKSATERINMKDYRTLTMAAQKDRKDPAKKVPLPFPGPRPAPVVPRF